MGITRGGVVYTAKVSQKGWIVIPKRLRDKYALRKGTYVRILDRGDALTIVPVPDDPVAALRGMLAGGPSLTEELLAERARDRSSEEDRGERDVRAR
jgi:AbrB family looped-hinge helix DNA binding protein